jgi:hypothetical protein
LTREWLISCKRYQTLGPTQARAVVQETLRDPANAPYGYVLAIGCNVSADTIAAIRDEATQLGANEVHIWSRAHLEDLLFDAKYEGLLFVYFGLMIRSSRRNRLQQIRAQSSLRRTLQRTLKIESMGQYQEYGPVVTLRDINDTHYPFWSRVENFAQMGCPPWQLARVSFFVPNGMVVQRTIYNGIWKDDGAWDYDELSGSNPAYASGMQEQQYWNQIEKERRDRHRHIDMNHEGKTLHVYENWLINYDDIVFVDAVGDGMRETPMIYCKYSGSDGPFSFLVNYTASVMNSHGFSRVPVSKDKRVSLYSYPEPDNRIVDSTGSGATPPDP